MPLRVTNTVEKSVSCYPVNPVVVPDSVATGVLAAANTVPFEMAGRYIQNVGGNDAYYAFGFDASSVAFCGILQSTGKQQLDCSNHGDRVSIFSVGGTTIAVTVLQRNDLIQAGTGIINQ